ncbi:MAG: response regulator [Bdellovibrionales bacterium]|nr:response regulator [Bdellovibrionales bacterium]
MSLLAGKLVLVVDDEPLLREIVRALIEDEGGSVIEAFDGDSAFALLQAQRVDLVISDVRCSYAYPKWRRISSKDQSQ